MRSCCGAVLDDFDNCFSVTCRACAPTTCAWCPATPPSPPTSVTRTCALRRESAPGRRLRRHGVLARRAPRAQAQAGSRDAYVRAHYVIAEAHDALL